MHLCHRVDVPRPSDIFLLLYMYGIVIIYYIWICVWWAVCLEWGVRSFIGFNAKEQSLCLTFYS